MKNSHTAGFQQRKDSIMGFGLVRFGFILDEKQGKQESLNWCKVIMNVADQNALQDWPHNIHKVNFLRGNIIQQWRTAQLSQM